MVQVNLSIAGFFVMVCFSCQSKTNAENNYNFHQKPITTNPKTIKEVPLPIGFERIVLNHNSFGQWLRNAPLKDKNVVYLYDGSRKVNQSGNFAVLNISTGNRDLQQCADALMRLRAEYLFEKDLLDEIVFSTGDGTNLSFVNYAKGQRFSEVNHSLKSYQLLNSRDCFSHECLLNFLNTVFAYCSTYSLKIMCSTKTNFDELTPGDLFVKAGSPGHAMIVADVAENKKTGKKIFLLLQSFMPAQDIHIVTNLNNESLSPWYPLKSSDWLTTPGYIFAYSDLRQWK